ncbi:MAG: adenosylhomocysteinase, partial [bacterium]|nr:adenosylhomocysteinase [bacterium]
VMPMAEAAPLGDLFCTVTGDINVVRGEHFEKMKDGAFVCNAGHFDVEVSINDLKKLAGEPKRIREHVDAYTIGKKVIYLLSEGRLVNLAAAEGHPASVMDMSFSTQALAAEWLTKQKKKPAPAVYDVSGEIEEGVARMKLGSMGISVDKLTEEQKKYLASWQEGT